MEAIIIKMAACLLAALALGFLFGWFIKRALSKETYGAQIEGLELDLAHKQDTVLKLESEKEHLEAQYFSNQEVLEASKLKTLNLEENLSSYQSKLTHVESTIKEKEAQLQEKEAHTTRIASKLLDVEKTLQEKDATLANYQEEITRIKQTHSSTQEEVQRFQNTLTTKEQEIVALNKKLNDYKNNESQYLQERSTYSKEVAKLQKSLNEKNIATVELDNKIKEIESLSTQNNTLSERLSEKEREITTLEAQNRDFQKSLESIENKLEQNKTVSHEELSLANTHHHTSTSKEGFDFWGMAKKTLKKVTETGEDIIAKGDKAIKDYKKTK